MGVYIKDVEIPESCPCVFVGVGYDLCCSFAYGIPKRVKEYDECCENGTRPDWCPLIEVPELHGDLIDRKELENVVEQFCLEDEHGDLHWWNALMNAPTVIPAEPAIEEKN